MDGIFVNYLYLTLFIDTVFRKSIKNNSIISYVLGLTLFHCTQKSHVGFFALWDTVFRSHVDCRMSLCFTENVHIIHLLSFKKSSMILKKKTKIALTKEV